MKVAIIFILLMGAVYAQKPQGGGSGGPGGGPAGPTGPTGMTGPTGATGATGAAGLAPTGTGPVTVIGSTLTNPAVNTGAVRINGSGTLVERDIFSVVDYGADPTGAADSVTGIQATITAVCAAGGGTVFFPAGTYKLNSYTTTSGQTYNLQAPCDNIAFAGPGDPGSVLIYQGPSGFTFMSSQYTSLLVIGEGTSNPSNVNNSYQNPSLNGGFYSANALAANTSLVTFTTAGFSTHFAAGDKVAIFGNAGVLSSANANVVYPEEASTVVAVGTGTITLEYPLARALSDSGTTLAYVANVTALTRQNITIRNLTLRGLLPFNIHQTFGFTVDNVKIQPDTTLNASYIPVYEGANTIVGWHFSNSTWGPFGTGTQLWQMELPAKASMRGEFGPGNTVNAPQLSSTEYSAHVNIHDNPLINLGTINGAKGDGTAGTTLYGMLISGSDVKVQDNTLHAISSTGGYDFQAGCGGCAWEDDHISFKGNHFYCDAGSTGGCVGTGIVDTDISNNKIDVNGTGAGIDLVGTNLHNVIVGNKISNHVNGYSGIGVCGTTTETPTITGNILEGNGTTGNAGILSNCGNTPTSSTISSGNQITGYANEHYFTGTHHIYLADPNAINGLTSASITFTPVNLPLATTGAFGAVKPDGSTITISGGVISSTGGSSGLPIQANTTPVATATNLNMQSGTYITQTVSNSSGTVTYQPDVDTTKIPTNAIIQAGQLTVVTTTSSSPTTYTGVMALNDPLTNYTANQRFIWNTGGTACTGSTSMTLNIDSLGAIPLKQGDGVTNLLASQCLANVPIEIKYDATLGVFRGPTASNPGTVTSAGWTGGIVSVATATTTPAFTVAGTSGGFPYFNSASTWASSAAGAAGNIVGWGGAGTAPTDTGVVAANVVTAASTCTSGNVVVGAGSRGITCPGDITDSSGAIAIPKTLSVGGYAIGSNTAIFGNSTPTTGISIVKIEDGAGQSTTAQLQGYNASNTLGWSITGGGKFSTQPGQGYNFIGVAASIGASTNEFLMSPDSVVNAFALNYGVSQASTYSMAFTSGVVVSWLPTNASGAGAATDTGFSRKTSTPGTIRVGNGAANDASGNLEFANAILSGTLTYNGNSPPTNSVVCYKAGGVMGYATNTGGVIGTTCN